MNVDALMERRVATVRPADNLDRAAELMRDRDCGSVVVVDEDHAVVGIVTDRDVCMAALRFARPLLSLSVADAMTAEPFTCRGTDTVQEAEDTMSLHQVRRLPVVDDRNKLLGLLALDDIAREACREVDLLAPPVSCAAVGRTLGQIARPHLIEGSSRRD